MSNEANNVQVNVDDYLKLLEDHNIQRQQYTYLRESINKILLSLYVKVTNGGHITLSDLEKVFPKNIER